MPATSFAGFAVVDLETTGLFPGGSDRVVEIGLVALDPYLRPVGEWSTLVNPCRDVGPTSIHGITASQVAEAPTFREIVGDVGAWLGDRILVGHNVRFDLSFLAAEFAYAGFRVQWVPGLCTMSLASSITGARRLDECCRCLGIEVGRSHSALCDAQSAAALLICCLQRMQANPPIYPPPMDRRALPAIQPSGHRVDRSSVPVAPKSSLASVVAQLPSVGLPIDARPEAVLAYVDLLDRILEDRRLTADEMASMSELAGQWGISEAAALAIHRSYFSGLARVALADGILTDLEREDLTTMAGLLGVSDALSDLRAAASGPAVGVSRSVELRGMKVCFTGESVCSQDGIPFDRARQQELAAAAGLIPVDSVTKQTNILVLADASSMSGKAKKADSYGVRKLAERSFWAAVGVRVD